MAFPHSHAPRSIAASYHITTRNGDGRAIYRTANAAWTLDKSARQLFTYGQALAEMERAKDARPYKGSMPRIVSEAG